MRTKTNPRVSHVKRSRCVVYQASASGGWSRWRENSAGAAGWRAGVRCRVVADVAAAVARGVAGWVRAARDASSRRP
jgi:hypothetical protein